MDLSFLHCLGVEMNESYFGKKDNWTEKKDENRERWTIII